MVSAERVLRSQQGFTLVELLVVIAIIGVLAAILIPSYTGAQKRSWDTAAVQCGRTIVTAQISYRANTGTYTDNVGVMGEDVTEVCASQNVRVGFHSVAPTATTASGLMSPANDSNFAFTVWHPNGSGWYRYWKTSPAPTASGDRLNTLFRW